MQNYFCVHLFILAIFLEATNLRLCCHLQCRKTWMSIFFAKKVFCESLFFELFRNFLKSTSGSMVQIKGKYCSTPRFFFILVFSYASKYLSVKKSIRVESEKIKSSYCCWPKPRIDKLYIGPYFHKHLLQKTSSLTNIDSQTSGR